MAELRARRVHSDERQTIIVVESFGTRHNIGDDLLGLFAWSEPAAVVVLSADGDRALGMDGNPLDLECLIHDAEELGALLKQLSADTAGY